jgi:ribulose-5-phosphate 4-epimerase/fuculose-1-phosphate aldolase
LSRASDADESDAARRCAVVAALERLDALGLNRGSTGNLSVRASGGGFWITPTGMGAGDTGPDDLVAVGDDGVPRFGRWAPSTEWPFHRAVYRARPDLGAVVHVHSPHATALACLREALPAFHYMVAIAGGADVPCVAYHRFGSEALSAAVAAGFEQRDACLLANHGLVTGGADLPRAMRVAVEVEALCGIYLSARAAGGTPALLSDDEMRAVCDAFRRYGRRVAGG